QTEQPVQYPPEPEFSMNHTQTGGQASSTERGLAARRTLSSAYASTKSNGAAHAAHESLNSAYVSSKPDRYSVSTGDSQVDRDGESVYTEDKDRQWIVRDAPEPPSLEGIVDLTNTVDVDVVETQAPGQISPLGSLSLYIVTDFSTAVTHETVFPEVHTIREEVITREIHYHNVYHRILPIIDVEVLPPRHFIRLPDGGLREADPEEVRGRLGNWQIVETVSQDPPESPGVFEMLSQQTEPEIVSQRTWIAPEGHPFTETVWKHPPMWEEGVTVIGASRPNMVPPPSPTWNEPTPLHQTASRSSNNGEPQNLDENQGTALPLRINQPILSVG
ncbi:MAG: hypothetical protein M4579_005604, partial [Chaenotheca gracillima]